MNNQSRNRFISRVASCIIWMLISQALMGQGLQPMKVNINVAAENAALTVKGAVVIASPEAGGTPRTSKVAIAQDGRIKKWLLFVEKGIVTERMCVDTIANWADDVFEEDYPLKELKEVESYIRKNGHLPGILSGETLKKDGYEPAEMQANFLRKIEELTLHQIAQQGKIEALKDKLAPYAAIEKRIEALENGHEGRVIEEWESKESTIRNFELVADEESLLTASIRTTQTLEPMQIMSASEGAVGVNLTGLEPGVAMNMSGRMVILGYADIDVPNFNTAPVELFCPSCKGNPDESPGTWSPKDDFLLFVKGGIAAEDWVCRDLATGWADYVFADDYDLLSLGEEKTFIEANGHLPGVPTEDQVRKGYELSGMSAILMAEIEERFLHLFDQRAELSMLNEELTVYTNKKWIKDISERLLRLNPEMAK